jgi:proteic killer suppression protein
VIVSFADHRTEALFHRAPAKGLPVDLQRAALRKLVMLDAAARLDDLRVPPGNRLQLLQGRLRGLNAIRVNDQWRVCFRWQDGDAFDVQLIDYH